jgi:cadmium resistance protein CadD (predicted permease)
MESKPGKGKAMGYILISLGAIFLAHNYLPDFDIERFWPIILIAIGISILLPGKKEKNS